MKRKSFLRNPVACAIFLAGLTMFSGCDKTGNENDEDVNTSTQTTAEFDNSNFGLYKGVIVGSSGTIMIEINNGNVEAKATLTIDGRTDKLTSTYSFVNGQAVVGAEFAGTFSNFTFSVNADGQNPTIANITIEGHDDVEVITAIIKETSTNVAMAYEGTIKGGNNASGAFNIVRNNNKFSVVSKTNDGGKSVIFNGTIGNDGSFNSSFTISNYHPGVDVRFNISGTFSGNTVSGTWSNSWGENSTNSGTFSGTKTL